MFTTTHLSETVVSFAFFVVRKYFNHAFPDF
jgi:hypothetical protein